MRFTTERIGLMAAGVSDVSDDESKDLAADLADAVPLLARTEALLRELGYRGQAERIAAFLREPQGEVKHG